MGTFGCMQPATADFFRDSKADLMIRNYYYNRDYRQNNATQSKAAEWAQGFGLNYESGFFNAGPVGIGVDATMMWGIRLDSGRGRSGTGLLPVHNNGDVPSNYAKASAALKLRYSKTEFRYGTQQPRMSVVWPNETRLFTQYFRGFSLISREVDNLSVNIGRFTRNIQRNSSAATDITVTNKSMTGLRPSDKFDYAELKYRWSSNLLTTYTYAHLHHNYHQHYVSLYHILPITEGQSLTSDLRYVRSGHEGQTNIDNKAIHGMLTYRLKGHSVGFGFQKMIGETGFAYLSGTNPDLVNFAQVNDFAGPGEKSWQLRYTFSFAELGFPGLTLMTRYIHGWDLRRPDRSHDEEWERDTYVDYAFQSGPLKNLTIQWRNATMRSDGPGNDLDENRFILTYSLPLL